jgi:WD40 repeat protein
MAASPAENAPAAASVRGVLARLPARSLALIALLVLYVLPIRGQWRSWRLVARLPEADHQLKGGRLLIRSKPGRLELWDVARCAPVGTAGAEGARVASYNFAPDGASFVTGEDDGDARVWSSSDAGLLLVLQGHTGAVEWASFSSDGREILTGSRDGGRDVFRDGSLRVWDAKTGECCTQIAMPWGPKSNSQARLSPDKSRILTGNMHDSSLRIADSGELVARLSPPGEDPDSSKFPYNAGATFMCGGRRILTTYLNYSPAVWDVDTGRLIGELAERGCPASSVSVLPDGRRVATGVGEEVLGHGWPDVRAGPTDQISTAWIWDAETGQCVRRLRGHAGPVRVRYSPDGRVLLAFPAVFDIDMPPRLRFTENTDARVWDPHTGRCIAVLRPGVYPIFKAAFSRDGTRIVTATCRNGVAVRGSSRSTPEEQERARREHCLDVNGIAVWATETGQQRAVMRGHADEIRAIAFDDTGERVLSASKDGTLRVWDSDAGTCLSVLPGILEYGYWSAEFASEDVVVARGSDNSVMLWRRHRPEWWWGVIWLRAFWVTSLLVVALLWSFRRDVRRIRAG